MERLMLRFLDRLISLYQVISRALPRRCRFYPSCSQYAREALAAHGLLTGLRLAASRILRCHPWNPGGVDPAPGTGR